MKKLLIRSPDCIPIAGVSRGAIYDLGRRKYYIIPNEFIELISEKIIDHDTWLDKYPTEEEHRTLNSFRDFLIQKELVLQCSEGLARNIADLRMNYDTPGHVLNTIIDFEIHSPYNLEQYISVVSQIGARHFLIRSYDSLLDDQYLELIYTLFRDSPVRSFEIIAKYNPSIHERAKLTIGNNARCKSIVLHSAPFNEYVHSDKGTAMGIVATTTQSITCPNDCYNNSIDYMNVNIELYLEAQQFHTYYYKKVCIDQNGLIKNCTSHSTNFGCFSPDTLLAVVTSSDFQKLWFAKKDDTKICRTCEFRYMCVDSREIFQNGNGTWFHTIPCNYDPEKSLWKNE